MCESSPKDEEHKTCVDLAFGVCARLRARPDELWRKFGSLGQTPPLSMVAWGGPGGRRGWASYRGWGGMRPIMLAGSGAPGVAAGALAPESAERRQSVARAAQATAAARS